jgi:hypothetical protein
LLDNEHDEETDAMRTSSHDENHSKEKIDENFLKAILKEENSVVVFEVPLS